MTHNGAAAGKAARLRLSARASDVVMAVWLPKLRKYMKETGEEELYMFAGEGSEEETCKFDDCMFAGEGGEIPAEVYERVFAILC